MSEHKENVPKIRFPGFSGEWEERRLGEVTTKIGSGKTPKGGNTSYVSVGVPLIRSQNIYDNCVHSDNVVYISPETDEDMKNSRVKKDDVLLNITGASIGRSAVYKHSDSANVNQHVCIIRPDDSVEADFIQLNLSSSNGQKEIDLNQAGGGREGLNFQQISKMSFFYPQKQEQRVISRFFKQLDHLINLHQSKLDRIKNLKAGLLQKMFPKNGEDVPEIRFSGFNEAWKASGLGVLTEVYDGTHQTPEYKGEGIMFLSVENIRTLQSEKYISEEAFENEFKVWPEKGDVLMTRIGDVGTANVVETNNPIAYYVSLALLKRRSLNPYFLQASIHSPAVQDEVWKRTLHIAFPKKINKNEIEKIPIKYPSKSEQDKIGLFFNNLDTLISLHQRKLGHLQQQKKALLQQMFV